MNPTLSLSDAYGTGNLLREKLADARPISVQVADLILAPQEDLAVKLAEQIGADIFYMEKDAATFKQMGAAAKGLGGAVLSAPGRLLGSVGRGAAALPTTIKIKATAAGQSGAGLLSRKTDEAKAFMSGKVDAAKNYAGQKVDAAKNYVEQKTDAVTGHLNNAASGVNQSVDRAGTNIERAGMGQAPIPKPAPAVVHPPKNASPYREPAAPQSQPAPQAAGTVHPPQAEPAHAPQQAAPQAAPAQGAPAPAASPAATVQPPAQQQAAPAQAPAGTVHPPQAQPSVAPQQAGQVQPPAPQPAAQPAAQHQAGAQEAAAVPEEDMLAKAEKAWQGTGLADGKWKGKLPAMVAGGLGVYGGYRALKKGLGVMGQEADESPIYGNGAVGPARGINEFGQPQLGGASLQLSEGSHMSSIGSGLFSTMVEKFVHLIKPGPGLSGAIHNLRADILKSLTPLAAVVVEEFTGPGAAAAAGLEVAAATTVAPLTVSSFLAGGVTALAAFPRNVTLTTAGVTPADAPASALVTGTDVNGNAQTETITVAQTATISEGVKAFKTVTSVVFAAAEGTAATVAIGYGSVLGLGKKLKPRAGLSAPIKEIAVGAVVTTGTFVSAATSPPNGSYSPASALDGAKDYALYYEYDASTETDGLALC